MRRQWTNSEGRLTPLHCSSEKSNLKTSLILLQSGVSLIDKDEKGNIAMESSLKWNRTEVFKTIVAFQKMNKKIFLRINSISKLYQCTCFKRSFATIRNEK